MKVVSDVKFEGNQAKQMLLDRRETAPENPEEGQVYYNINMHKFYFYNGTTWVSIG